MSVGFDAHFAYTDEERRPLLSRLRREVLALDNSLNEKITAGQRIAYSKRGRNIFLEVKVQRHAIVLHMVEVPDPDGLLSAIPESHEWNQLARRGKILNNAELDRLLPLIRVAWLRS
jgi:predicted transport protein